MGCVCRLSCVNVLLLASTRLNWVVSVGACLVYDLQFPRNPLLFLNFDENFRSAVLKIIIFGWCTVLGCCWSMYF